MRIGLIGLGRWGSIFLQNLDLNPSIELIIAAGKSNQVTTQQKSKKIKLTDDWMKVSSDTSLDGLIIACPPVNQYEVVKYAIKTSIPLLVEKPFTLCSIQTVELANLTKKNNIFCMIDYTHLFSLGYQDLKKCVSLSGAVKNIFSEGLSIGPIRPNVPVLWDWGSHDISMCIDLLEESPSSITVETIHKNLDKHNSEILKIHMHFDSNIEARCVVGNASQFKRRDFCVVCDKGVFVYDGLSSGLSKQYSNEVISNDLNRYNIQKSPLENVIDEFLNSIKLNKTSHFTLDLATRVNDVLDRVNVI